MEEYTDTWPKSCGSCSLCCKLPTIPELDKSYNKWCPDCTPGKGCGIWKTRPDVCRNFYCIWLASPNMPDKYRPDKIKLYAAGTNEQEILQVLVDPAYPLAWREGLGKEVIDGLSERGHHMLIIINKTERRFVQGVGKPIPERVQKLIKEHGDKILQREVV